LCKNNWRGGEPAADAFHLSSTEAAGLFQDILERGLSLRVKATGRSMMPFLMGGEILTIKKVSSASLKRGDLLFFRNPHGYPVLHRVIRKKLDKNVFIFHTKGDALGQFDEPVTDNHVLGKVSTIERKHTNCARPINLESFFWVAMNYLAALNILIGSRARFALRKLMGR
jgi:signal peptidase I